MDTNSRLDAIYEMGANWTAAYRKTATVAAKYYPEDSDNCSVMALSIALGVSYGKAQAALTKAGRPIGEGATVMQIREACAMLGYSMSIRTEMTNMTVAQVAKEDPEAKRLVIVRGSEGPHTGHILAVVHGVPHDHMGSRKRVVWGYELEVLTDA